MIYFITDGNCIKIGYTKNDVRKRLKQLQTSNPNRLFLLGYVEGDKNDEKMLHKKFSSSIVRINGEWFSPTQDLLDFINDNSLDDNTYVDIIDNQVRGLFRLRGV